MRTFLSSRSASLALCLAVVFIACDAQDSVSQRCRVPELDVQRSEHAGLHQFDTVEYRGTLFHVRRVEGGVVNIVWCSNDELQRLSLFGARGVNRLDTSMLDQGRVILYINSNGSVTSYEEAYVLDLSTDGIHVSMAITSSFSQAMDETSYSLDIDLAALRLYQFDRSRDVRGRGDSTSGSALDTIPLTYDESLGVFYQIERYVGEVEARTMGILGDSISYTRELINIDASVPAIRYVGGEVVYIRGMWWSVNGNKSIQALYDK